MPVDASFESITVFVEAKPKSLRRMVYPAALVQHGKVGACWYPISYLELVSDLAANDGGESRGWKIVPTDLGRLNADTGGLHAYGDVFHIPTQHGL